MSGVPFAGIVVVVAVVAAVALVTGCGDDDDDDVVDGRGATAPPAATAPVATGATSTTGGEVVRLIVTPEAGIAPGALGEQLVDVIGPDLVVVDVQRATVVVTVPVDRQAEVEAVPGVAAVQPDVAEPAG